LALSVKNSGQDHKGGIVLLRSKFFIQNQPAQYDCKDRDQVDKRRGVAGWDAAKPEIIKAIGTETDESTEVHHSHCPTEIEVGRHNGRR